MPTDLSTAKARVAAEVDRCAPMLVDLAHRIHANPELMFEERFASDLVATALEDAGFAVERGAYGLETAFVGVLDGDERANAGTGANVGIICEYDALPGIGHGCGHNIIAAAGLGAALAAATAVREGTGRLTVFGTPAEEGGGGKVLMGDRGAFESVDAMMMVHPASTDLAWPDVLAIATWRVTYRGRAAHAAASPEMGRNALDAAVLGYNAVAALRQHMAPTERVHGVFTEAGGKPNIVPDHTVAEWYVRSATAVSLQALKERVTACLAAGAAAAGCSMELQPIAPEYCDLRSNRALIELYRSNSEGLGRPLRDPGVGDRMVVSTDMGNVSYRVPSIHPMIAIASPEVPIHSEAFACHAVGVDGDRAVIDGAKAMAMTAVDLWLGDDALQGVRASFDPAP